ncbi:group II intron reverse transcriptase/maturase [Shimazuella sp. AN120528]|uniref:group II intron reverse transcriptase/maturase n=1 Tax=Shimazuella soli TaxID=1892854 RepID=UPI001F0E891B|nr:group II intron reverse transcriptase/maturase [Shimazuella soli]MCH5585048.1 group II intron reverse transcriptase/maturase [Shimazuella soli]
MQTAEVILSLLGQKAKNDENFVFQRLYRHLFNPDMYLSAYAKIYSKEGNMTAGVDGKTIDGFNVEIVNRIIEKMKKETYYPNPVLRKHIPKKSGGQRPLGIPSFEDKLVQEVLRLILEAIYEPKFLDTSHGFRPKRSCHTALHTIKSTCKGSNWVIEGDIKSFFDNIDHEVLLCLLSKKIDDGRMIELIRRFLRAGYLEFKQKHPTFSGTPQGGIISPILSNVYLHELDQFMKEICEKYSTDTVRKRNKEYMSWNSKRHQAQKKGDVEIAKIALEHMRKLPAQDPLDQDYIKVKYVRYADDFLVLIIGSKALANEIRDQTRDFLAQQLKLELNMDKTLITNLSNDRVKFLGYEIAKTKEDTKLTENTLGVKKRAANETIQLLVPSEVIREKLKPFVQNGKSVHHNARINLPILDMIAQYNAEIKGLYNYYCLATDVSTKIGKLKYYHYYSLVKTIARKEKCSVKKVIDKYGIDVKLKNGTGTRKLVGMKYMTKTEGEKVITYFNQSIKKVNSPKAEDVDTQKFNILGRSQIFDRLNAKECELCGLKSEEREFGDPSHSKAERYKKEVHQARETDSSMGAIYE